PVNIELRMQILDTAGTELLGNDGGLVSDAIPMQTFTSAWSIAIDDSDHLFLGVTGTSGNTGYLFKVDPSGTVLWNVVIPDAINTKVTLTNGGGAVISWLNTSTFNLNMQKFDSTGSSVWNGATALSVQSVPADVYELSNGELILVYHLLGFGVSSTLYAQRFDSMGAAVWSSAVQLSDKTTQFNIPYGGLIDNDVVYYGYYPSSGFRFDSYLQRINDDGTLPWGINGVDFDTNQTDYEMETEIAMDATSSELYAICTYRDPTQNNTGERVQKIDITTGSRLFGDNAKELFSIGSQNKHAGSLFLSDGVPVFLVESGLDNGGSPTTLNACVLDSNGEFLLPNDLEPLATFTADKSRVQWTQPVNNQAVAVFTEDRGAGQEIFAQNFTSQLLSITNESIPLAIDFNSVVEKKLELHSSTTIDLVEIYDLAGQLVASKNFSDDNYSINLEELEAGLYISHAIFANDTIESFKILKR
ncbi:MAG: T9SS type A sorting domain-containing protein, partial [Nonlabens sp.]